MEKSALPGPKVTIVVPAYNHADHLVQAIDSVLQQDYSNIELIVLDDGSTDDTRRVLEGYGTRFYWETHANRGQSATLNKGWEMAQGDILSYLSADDRLLPNAISAAVGVLSVHDNIVMTYCDFDLIDRDGNVLRTVTAPNYSYYEMVVKTVCSPGPGVFFRRTAWRQAGGWNPDLRLWPDYDYWLRLGLQGDFLRITKCCAQFRVHDKSLTFAPVAADRAEEPIRILQAFYDAPHRLPIDVANAKRRAICSATLACAQLHLRSGRWAAGFARIGVAARLHWPSLFSGRTWKLILHGLLARPLMLFRIGLKRVM